MNQSVTAVIGTGYGDEGKGVLVDTLAAAADGEVVVVRFNGGAQAGHTVQLQNGARHVFSHFGAGSFAGAATWLSRHFVSNPILFKRELGELFKVGVPKPRVMVDPASPVTTPWDMMINTMVEDARGAARHGSVGVGFGETLERGLHLHPSITVGDLFLGDALRQRLDDIRHQWVPQRLAALGFPGLEKQWAHVVLSDAVVDAWLADAALFLACVDLCESDILRIYPNVIFEGAQGLMLDQDIGRKLGQWPHVTRSNTGLKNALQIAQEARLEGLDVIWATRAYTTRHGAGPLEGEVPQLPWANVVDETNHAHAYQGSLRLAPLSLPRLMAAVYGDMDLSVTGQVRIRQNTLAISCMDQLNQRVAWVDRRGAMATGSRQDLADAATLAIGADHQLQGWGPTRNLLYSKKSDALSKWWPTRSISPAGPK